MKFKTPIFLIFSFSIIFSIDYQTQIQPIFSQYCTGCHPNGGGLSLTTYDNVLDGGNDGMVITVYDQNSSVLYDRITRQESENGDMPPAGSLSQNQIAIIGQWISEGALPYEVDHSNMAYGDDIYPILEENCSSGYCHGGDAGGLNVLSYDQLIEGGTHGPVIIPGNGYDSNLIMKLSAAPPFGSQMPLSMLALHPLTINKIFVWINEGATPDEPSELEINIQNSEGWNMVGLPLIVEEPSQLNIFPESIENTMYTFSDGYSQVAELIIGNGYWLRFDTDGYSTVIGNPIENLSLTLNEGWNMISGTSFSEPNINDPDNILVEGTLYKFNNGYIQASILEPGIGYWIRANADGEILLENMLNVNSRDNGIISKIKKPFSHNIISINNIALMFGGTVNSSDLIKYSLPPKPPLGAFDVRFDNDMKLSDSGGRIEIQSSTKPLRIETHISNNENWILINYNTKEEYNLNDNSVLIISSTEDLFLKKDTEVTIPSHFSLYQNYPNPFNPSTEIKYKLARTEKILLSIFDAKGSLVRTLVSDIEYPGTYSVVWNGLNMNGIASPAGIYFYKLSTADNYISKQMILLR